MAGGKREGAGRPPVPVKKQKQSITITIRPDQIKWVRETKPKGWLAKIIENKLDEEMSKMTKAQKIEALRKASVNITKENGGKFVSTTITDDDRKANNVFYRINNVYVTLCNRLHAGVDIKAKNEDVPFVYLELREEQWSVADELIKRACLGE